MRQIADSIERFGFTNPVLISDDGELVAGHGRVMAAKQLGVGQVPTVKLLHLRSEERRAYALAANKLTLNAGWATQILAIELQALIDLESDVSLTGFSLAEIDLTLDVPQVLMSDTLALENAVIDGIAAFLENRILPLGLRAPKFVEAIATGRQPVELTTRRLKWLADLPVTW